MTTNLYDATNAHGRAHGEICDAVFELQSRSEIFESFTKGAESALGMAERIRSQDQRTQISDFKPTVYYASAVMGAYVNENGTPRRRGQERDGRAAKRQRWLANGAAEFSRQGGAKAAQKRKGSAEDERKGKRG